MFGKHRIANTWDHNVETRQENAERITKKTIARQ